MKLEQGKLYWIRVRKEWNTARWKPSCDGDESPWLCGTSFLGMKWVHEDEVGVVGPEVKPPQPIELHQATWRNAHPEPSPFFTLAGGVTRPQ